MSKKMSSNLPGRHQQQVHLLPAVQATEEIVWESAIVYRNNFLSNTQDNYVPLY